MANESPQQKVDNVDAGIASAPDATAAKTVAESFLTELSGKDAATIQQTTDALFKKPDMAPTPSSSDLLRPGSTVTTDKTAGGLLPILALTRYEQLTQGADKGLTPEQLLAKDTGIVGRNALDTKLLTYLRDNPGILNRIRNTDTTMSSGAISADIQNYINLKRQNAEIALKSTPAYQMARDLYGPRDNATGPHKTLYDAVFANTGRTGSTATEQPFLYKDDIDKAIADATKLGLSPTEVQSLQRISSSWEGLKSAGIAPDRYPSYPGDYSAISRGSFGNAFGWGPEKGARLQEMVNGDQQFRVTSGPTDGVPTPGKPVVREYTDGRKVTIDSDGLRVTEYPGSFANRDLAGSRKSEYPSTYRDKNLAGTTVTVRPGDQPNETVTQTTYGADYKGDRAAFLKGATITERTVAGKVTEKKTVLAPETTIQNILDADPSMRNKFPDLANNRTANGITIVERDGSQMLTASKYNVSTAAQEKFYSGQYPGKPPFAAITDNAGVVKQFTQNGETFRQDALDSTKYRRWDGVSSGERVGVSNMKLTPDGTFSYTDQSGTARTDKFELGATTAPVIDNTWKPVNGNNREMRKEYPGDAGSITVLRDNKDQPQSIRIKDKAGADQLVFQRGPNNTWTVKETTGNPVRLTEAPTFNQVDGSMMYKTQTGMETTIRGDGRRLLTGFDDGRGHTFKAEYDNSGTLAKLSLGNDVYTAKPGGGYTGPTGDLSAIRIDPSNGKIQLESPTVTREVNPSLDYNPRIVSARHFDGGQVNMSYDPKTGVLNGVDYTKGATTEKLSYNATTGKWKDASGKEVGAPRVGDNGAVNFVRNNADVSLGGAVITTDVAAAGKAVFESSPRGPEKITYPDKRTVTFGYSDATALSGSVLNSITRQGNNGGTEQLQMDLATKQWTRTGPSGEKIPISKPEWDKAGNITFKEGTMTKVWPDNGGVPRVTKMDYPGTNGWVDLNYGPTGLLESAKVTGAAPARNRVELRGNLQLDSNTGTLTHTDGGVTTQIKADGTKVVSRTEPGTGRTIDFNFSNVGGRSLEEASSVVVRGTNNIAEIYSRDGNSWKKDGVPPVKGRLKYENGTLNFTPDPSDTALGVTPTVVDQSLTAPNGTRLEPPKVVTSGTRTGGLQGSEFGSQGPWGVANNLLKEKGVAQDSAAVDALRKVLQDTNPGVDFMSLAGGTQLIHDGNREAVRNAIKALIEGNGRMKGNARLTKLLSRL
ncbi:MAG: hypothetical protein SFY67_11705 [Candidatus Melainabacteria bacterium]|nr:hypothetical protein [Candidatus Melainabacteria bacterium]